MNKTTASETCLPSSTVKSNIRKRIVSILAVPGIAVAPTPISPATGETSDSKKFKPPVADKFTPLEIGQVKLTGLLGKHVDSVPQRLMKGQGEAYLAVFHHPSDSNSWRAEHFGKWLEAACNTMIYQKDDKPRATVDEVVSRLLDLQQPDGWLGSYASEYRFQHYDWNRNAAKKFAPFYDGPFYDIWCHYMTMDGLLRYYETTGNQRALDAVRKIADLLIATFGDGNQDMMLINHDHGFGPGVGLFPISKLYLLAGDARYRDFARYITTQFGRKGRVPIMMTSTEMDGYPFPDWAHIKHCEFELCLNGICQLYRGTGERKFLATTRNLYESYFAPLNDTMCLHGFKNPPPGMTVPDTYYGFLETCDIVPTLRWDVEMTRITGDSKYMDALEWNLYNTLLSRDLPDGRVWPGVEPPTSNCFHCCYSMLSVGMSSVPMWTYFTQTNGIMVNLYESSVLSTRIAGVKVNIEQTTEYPLDGTVTLKIEPEHRASFNLFLRIPKWCQSARVLVNGKAPGTSKPEPGEFFKIYRRWKAPTIVTLILDMRGRALRRKFSRNAGQPAITLERGPLLLAMTAKLNPGLNLTTISPVIGPADTVTLKAMTELKAANSDSVRFLATGTIIGPCSGNGKPAQTAMLITPYAFSGVSDKPMPPPKEGVFNVYSEDAEGEAVRVKFQTSPSD
jgi:DUF1680 family protein